MELRVSALVLPSLKITIAAAVPKNTTAAMLCLDSFLSRFGPSGFNVSPDMGKD